MKIIAIGNIKESYLREGCNEYIQRLCKSYGPEIIEIKDKTLDQEAESILKQIKTEFLIVMDEKGKSFTSLEMAEFIKKKHSEGRKLCFVVGSSDGLSQKVKDKADLLLSLSKMTFTHEMARLFLLEQIYRAHMINSGRKYNK